MGPVKRSVIWEYFQEDEIDYTNAKCSVPGCKRPLVSRGKTGTPRSKLSTTNLTSHLYTYHPKKFNDYNEKKSRESEKRKRGEDENSGD